VLLGVLAGGFAIYRTQTGTKKSDVRYETVKADRGRIVAKVTATGTLSALVTVQVGAQVSGRLLQINVDFNSPVKKGEVIAKLDPQLYQAAAEQVRANFSVAQSNLKKAKAQAADAERQLTRAKGLFERQLSAQADLDTAQANFDIAQAGAEAAASSVEQARASMNQAQVNLGYTTIVSPIDGMVVSRNVDVGQTVAASLSAPTLFVIAEDLRKMQVDTSVSEADVGKLAPGMSASFLVDAYPGERFKGLVRQIRNSPQTVQNIVTYDAVIDVENPELKLKPGMTANVTFIFAERDDVLRLPNAALRYRPPADTIEKPAAAPKAGPRAKPTETGKRTVWLLKDGAPAAAVVTTGVSDGSLTELVEGEVREGDLLITDGAGAGASPAGAAPTRIPRMF
jgi:HlyD family secretion protein